jgi:hypothetical protein
MKVTIEWDELDQRFKIEASDLMRFSEVWTRTDKGTLHMNLTKEDLKDLYYAIEEVFHVEPKPEPKKLRAWMGCTGIVCLGTEAKIEEQKQVKLNPDGITWEII